MKKKLDELTAMKRILEILASFDGEARNRVWSWVSSRYYEEKERRFHASDVELPEFLQAPAEVTPNE